MAVPAMQDPLLFAFPILMLITSNIQTAESHIREFGLVRSDITSLGKGKRATSCTMSSRRKTSVLKHRCSPLGTVPRPSCNRKRSQ